MNTIEFWQRFLVQDGDLPQFHNADDIVIIGTESPILRNFPGAVLKLTQWIGNVEREGEQGGGVDIIVFSDSQSAAARYAKIASGEQELEGVGERAVVYEMPIPERTEVTFLRCTLVVKVWGIWQLDPRKPRGFLKKDDVVRYAKRIDDRIFRDLCD